MENTHEAQSVNTGAAASKLRTKEQIDQEYTILAQQVGDMILKTVPYLIYALGKTVELQKEPKAVVEVKAAVTPEVLPAENA